MSARRFQVENQARWLGWCVRERGVRRIAVFFRRSEARDYARWLNERATLSERGTPQSPGDGLSGPPRSESATDQNKLLAVAEAARRFVDADEHYDTDGDAVWHPALMRLKKTLVSL